MSFDSQQFSSNEKGLKQGTELSPESNPWYKFAQEIWQRSTEGGPHKPSEYIEPPAKRDPCGDHNKETLPENPGEPNKLREQTPMTNPDHHDPIEALPGFGWALPPLQF